MNGGEGLAACEAQFRVKRTNCSYRRLLPSGVIRNSSISTERERERGGLWEEAGGRREERGERR